MPESSTPEYPDSPSYGDAPSRGRVDDGFGRGDDFGSTTRYGAGRPSPADEYAAAAAPDRSDSEPPGSASARRGRFSMFGASEFGAPGWLAVIVMIIIAAIGAGIDSGGAGGGAVPAGFGWGLVAGALVAGIVVRRSGLFSVVVAPPLVYAIASAILVYARSGGLKNRGVLIDSASNLLVYGFPAIAGATAIVLLIAGVRIVVRR